MTFQWPEMLWLLPALRALGAAYVLVLRRKKKFALRFASLDIVKEAMGKGAGFRRHVPPLLFLLGLAVMILAVARPTATVILPSQHETVILAMDVSGSMRATDVEPNRLVAAPRLAAERGVSISTVGIGTTAGETIGFDGWSMHVGLEEETLKAIADVTRGEYFYAGNAPDLKKVYQTPNAKLVLENRKTFL